MQKGGNNFAFIDGQNLYLGIREQGWRLDFARFRIYLREHYGVHRAFLFLGYLPTQQNLYKQLKFDGYDLVFKEIVFVKNYTIKGNCDAELVLHAVARMPQSVFGFIEKGGRRTSSFAYHT